MRVKDKALNKMIDVSQEDCPTFTCYWPRPDPGIFTQGQGYRKASVDRGWICGNREIRGCPDCPKKDTSKGEVK